MAAVVLNDLRGMPVQIDNASPHMKLKDLFLSVEKASGVCPDRDVVFVAGGRNLCPNTTIGSAGSNHIGVLRRINSKGHELIEHDPEESGSIRRSSSASTSSLQSH